MLRSGRPSVAPASGTTAVKADRSAWLRGKADHIAGQVAVGLQAPMWELVRQLAGKRAARGPRPIAVQRSADGSLISTQDELISCWEGLFAAEFSGHTSVLEFSEARQAVEGILS